MSTAATKSPPVPSVVLFGVPWDDYETMLRIVGNRPIRINYDCGEMEIMSPLYRHSNNSYLLGRMVDTLTDELKIPCEPADPVTLRRPDLEKGVEPDKLYYLRDRSGGSTMTNASSSTSDRRDLSTPGPQPRLPDLPPRRRRPISGRRPGRGQDRLDSRLPRVRPRPFRPATRLGAEPAPQDSSRSRGHAPNGGWVELCEPHQPIGR